MTFLYELTRLLTFPGAFVRCFWEQIVCRICGVPVEDNRYLRADELSSHVDHELMPTASSAFAICFVPAFFNAIGAFALAIIPLALLMKLFRRKLIYIESFAKVTSKTLSGKLLYKYADQFYVQWEEMLKLYPNAIYKGGIY